MSRYPNPGTLNASKKYQPYRACVFDIHSNPIRASILGVSKIRKQVKYCRAAHPVKSYSVTVMKPPIRLSDLNEYHSPIKLLESNHHS